MTKAELAVIQEKVAYPPNGAVPADINICRDDVRSLLDHISALEAQLAQRDERIRKLTERVNTYHSCQCTEYILKELGTHIGSCPAVIGEWILAADRLLAGSNAKEGEGK